jgi:hypothetical protein
MRGTVAEPPALAGEHWVAAQGCYPLAGEASEAGGLPGLAVLVAYARG